MLAIKSPGRKEMRPALSRANADRMYAASAPARPGSRKSLPITTRETSTMAVSTPLRCRPASSAPCVTTSGPLLSSTLPDGVSKEKNVTPSTTMSAGRIRGLPLPMAQDSTKKRSAMPQTTASRREHSTAASASTARAASTMPRREGRTAGSSPAKPCQAPLPKAAYQSDCRSKRFAKMPSRRPLSSPEPRSSGAM